jgi:hypothetical protein
MSALQLASSTQPLMSPWRRVARATRLHISLERVAVLVVEDTDHPVAKLGARVFDVELVAQLRLVADDGAIIESRRVSGCAAELELFVQRVSDIVEWATLSRPGIEVQVRSDRSTVWSAVCQSLAGVSERVAQHIGRPPTTPEAAIDHRLRVA